jgi:RNA recognition motif-containing protein
MPVARLFVGNFPWETTDDELFRFFSRYVDVAAVKITRDRDTGKSRGFAFLDLTELSDVDEALALDGYNFGGRELRVRPVREKTR